jgi:hypothetical protein
VSTTVDPTPDYCLYCGIRLRDEADPLSAHFDRHRDCRERSEARADTSGENTAETGDGNPRVRSALMWLIMSGVLAYSLLIAQQLLLGFVAAVLVYAAFQCATD